jgi:hypothetical protein
MLVSQGNGRVGVIYNGEGSGPSLQPGRCFFIVITASVNTSADLYVVMILFRTRVNTYRALPDHGLIRKKSEKGWAAF